MTGPIDPDAILRQPFTSVKRGYDPLEVQTFLMSIAGELRAARDRTRELERAVADAERQLAELREPSASRLTALLGEEMARVLDAANAAAADIRSKAEQEAAEALEEARAEARRIRTEAEAAAAAERAAAEEAAAEIRQQVEGLLEQARADAEQEVEAGRQQGREMVAQAQQVRERMLRDLARRRKLLRQQIEQLQAGRDRLLAAYDVVRQHLDEVTEELTVALPEARQAAEAAASREGEDTSDEALDRELTELAAGAGIDLDATDQVGAVEGSAGGAGSRVPEEEAPETDATRTAPPADADVVEPSGPRAPDPVAGRKSSAVKIIRTGRAREPDELLEDEEPVEAPSEGAVAPGRDGAGGGGDAVAETGSAAKVAGLFARIKEEASQLDSSGLVIDLDRLDAGDVDAGDVDAGDVDAGRAGGDPAGGAEPAAPATPIERRDEATSSIERELARRLKRELSDEQNELLDVMRQQRGVPAPEAVLPAPEAHVERFASVALASLVAAYTAGGDFDGGSGPEGQAPSSGRVAELSAEMAAGLVGPLRGRLERCFAEVGDDPDELVDRLRSCYRECRTQHVEEAASFGVLAAFNLGVVDGLAEGSAVRWIVDDPATAARECVDNARAGDWVKGKPFPSGHPLPPARPTCRCLVVPARM